MRHGLAGLLCFAIGVGTACGGGTTGGPIDAAPPDGVFNPCGPDLIDCGGLCVSGLDNAENCGTCGNACGGATPFCSGTSCVATCDAPRTDCGGACVDLANDPRHCGACATDCGSAGTCAGGSCGACAAPAVDCTGYCADTTTDADHCGGCGLQCDRFTEVCAASSCECKAGLTNCATGPALDCRNLQSDGESCGVCGQLCAQGQVCQDGACSCPAPSVDDGTGNCVDPGANPAACGTPPVTCGGATPLCEGGACVAACSGGLTDCGGGCVDTQTNPLHCGSCNQPVGPEEICIDGQERDIQVATGCSACPCEVCAGDKPCCPHPITGVPLCVDAPACP